MSLVVGVILFVVGVVNGLPVVGVAGAGPLTTLYGTSLTDPDLLVLMRHRAILLGLLGAVLVAAAFLPTLRPAAIIAGLVSMVGFVVLAHLVGGIDPKLRTTVLIDVALSAALLVALALHLVGGTAPPGAT
ncbi:hypothetical protein [Pseudonocardia sp. KRD291]|uniref:hypothetical protein n=1 Tax=Pseudonocardia sp. KRD291 TaxID=2792007 RepID=UPI001C4A0100|nr:hypothetical protein [Pseudonocardia sp. KRD291]MBW0104092.1 phosphopantetheine adenylyltransferase [Pseudonocardia sp. KRD291]